MQHLQLYYIVSVSFLLLSSLLSGLELLFTPRRFLNFVYPSTTAKHKWEIWSIVHILQVTLAPIAFLLLLRLDEDGFKLAFLGLAAINLYSYRLRTIGKDGSDQVRLIGLLSYSLCFLVTGDQGKIIALYFMGLQVILGYTTSGVLKIASPYWRKGDVLAGILGTYAYGVPRVSKLLLRHPLLEKACTYSAILMMVAVLFTFCLPFQLPLLIALSAIFCFHFATSVLMGLNDFLYTFPMAYPGILLLHEWIFR